MDTLLEENLQVVALVQAMLGAISPNFRAVSLRYRDGVVDLFFVLAEQSPVDREEIDDIAFEFEALQDRPRLESTTVIVSSEPDVPELPGRTVYRRREPESGQI